MRRVHNRSRSRVRECAGQTAWYKIHIPIGVIGGALYVLIEFIWRGRSHWTMFLLGGLCFVIIGVLNEVWPCASALAQMALGALIVTGLELVFGLILNVWLGLGVWDYSDIAFNLWGQVCLGYTVLWFFLAGVTIWLEDWLHAMFEEKKKKRGCEK